MITVEWGGSQEGDEEEDVMDEDIRRGLEEGNEEREGDLSERSSCYAMSPCLLLRHTRYFAIIKTQATHDLDSKN